MSAIGQLKQQVKTVPEKFIRYNKWLVAQGYPVLVFVTRDSLGRPLYYSFNTDYTLKGWGLVFPHSVQFYAYLHAGTDKEVNIGEQFLFPIEDIYKSPEQSLY